jgi:hypothetical protein
VLSLLIAAVAQRSDRDLRISSETNDWDIYKVVTEHRHVTDVYVECWFKPIEHSVNMQVQILRRSDTSWGYSAGCRDGDAHACATMTLAVAESALTAAHQQHREVHSSYSRSPFHDSVTR